MPVSLLWLSIVYGAALAVATFLGALTAGFLFAFAVIVMPGIARLRDRDCLRSFQAIDRIIQDGQPLFMVMWLGSSLSLIGAAVVSFGCRDGVEQAVVTAAAVASIGLVQAPTMRINIPLNNVVQSLDLDSIDDASVAQARADFEAPWNRWNNLRTLVACVILIVLLWLLWRL